MRRASGLMALWLVGACGGQQMGRPSGIAAAIAAEPAEAVEPEPAPVPVPAAAPAEAPVAAPVLAPASWSVCPKGTTARGSAGSELYCARPDGTRHGPYTAWHPTGSISREGAYEAGKEQGEWELRDGQGRLTERGTYQRGQRHGAWAEFFEGRLSGEGPYVHGKKHGMWLHRGDQFELEVTWKNGVKVKSRETVAPRQ